MTRELAEQRWRTWEPRWWPPWSCRGRGRIGVEARWELTGSAAGGASALAFMAKAPLRKKSWEMWSIWWSQVKAPSPKGLPIRCRGFEASYTRGQRKQFAVQWETGCKGELRTQCGVMGAKEPSGRTEQVERWASHMPVHNCMQPVGHRSAKYGCRQKNTANESQPPAVLSHIQRENLNFKVAKWVSWEAHLVLCLCNIFKFAPRHLDTGSLNMHLLLCRSL